MNGVIINSLHCGRDQDEIYSTFVKSGRRADFDREAGFCSTLQKVVWKTLLARRVVDQQSAGSGSPRSRSSSTESTRIRSSPTWRTVFMSTDAACDWMDEPTFPRDEGRLTLDPSFPVGKHGGARRRLGAGADVRATTCPIVDHVGIEDIIPLAECSPCDAEAPSRT